MCCIQKYLRILLMVLCIFFVFAGCKRAKEDDNIVNEAGDGDISNEKECQDNSGKELTIYVDENFGFSVKYPANLYSKVEPIWEGTAEQEGSPDGGINIYFDDNKEEYLYVFGQHGHINLDGNEKEEFETFKGVSGYLYSYNYDGKIVKHLILDPGFHGAYLRVSNDIYNQYEQQIVDILRSIDILEDTQQ